MTHQLRLDQPPEVRQTLERLQREGFGKRDAKDLICAALNADIQEAIKTRRPYSREAYAKKLSELPDVGGLREEIRRLLRRRRD